MNAAVLTAVMRSVATHYRLAVLSEVSMRLAELPTFAAVDEKAVGSLAASPPHPDNAAEAPGHGMNDPAP